MNKHTIEISTVESLQLRLLKLGMILCLTGGMSFLLFACGSSKMSDSTNSDSTSLSSDSITTTTNGADTTVALDSVKPISDTMHK
ncbi:hypothetical protein GA0116948_12416 [Chitinophaga costaii]|uniref:Uncharacterized protein n=1 Tax=Chitinophaga costaii TaxID=1335309 RepID=A0A1C4G5Z9_9BACT|nr:hypothetical protein [Chitinophaga costaii]PUZ20101.1 hypothetical protein DCM91_19395 [Chitinophaga costaii]SCC63582.1 hypothetical protein GA0116948_12416 [Chitinophaga costaii]